MPSSWERMTASLPGKIRHLRGGRGGNGDQAEQMVHGEDEPLTTSR